ncbi:MAG: hypothetical protein KKA42_13655 [candidate division Zixibacteria bacterium]|nr:hypothetical protein [candidate division Zixibacteria bacterium]
MDSRRTIFGAILILIGLLLWVNSMGLMHFTVGDFFRLLIPVGFILLGAWLIVRRNRLNRTAPDDPLSAGRSAPPPPPPPGGPTEHRTTAGYQQPFDRPQAPQAPSRQAADKLKYEKLFGDMFIDCTGVKLHSVEVSSFVGDVEVKLHGGELQHGLNRMILSGFVGDVRVLVPPNMAVFVQVSNFIGDVELMGRRSSGFGNNIDYQSPDYQTAESKLYIASNHFIGDVRVYVV